MITQVIDSDFYPPTEDARSVGNASVLHNFPQVRKIALETPDLVQLLLILNDENVALAVLQNVFAGISPIGGVDTCGESPRENCGQIRNVPLGRVEAENADGAVFLQPEINERLGDSSGLLMILRPGPDRLHRYFNNIINIRIRKQLDVPW